MTSSSSDQPKSGKSHRKQKKSTGSGNAAGGRRKLTLEELEMEGFGESVTSDDTDCRTDRYYLYEEIVLSFITCVP